MQGGILQITIVCARVYMYARQERRRQRRQRQSYASLSGNNDDDDNDNDNVDPIPLYEQAVLQWRQAKGLGACSYPPLICDEIKGTHAGRVGL